MATEFVTPAEFRRTCLVAGFDDRVMRKLLVGATRASMKLMLVMSERAAGMLMSRATEAPLPNNN